MCHGTRRFVALVAGGVAVIAAALVTYLLLPARQTGDTAVPAGVATPEQVVTAYLDALNAHDCDTARAVMTADAEGSAESWCENVASLTDVAVGNHLTERPEDSGHTAPEEVVNVPVSFDLDWRPLHHDPSMAEDPTTWGFLLVRASTNSPWRIVDQGTG